VSSAQTTSVPLHVPSSSNVTATSNARPRQAAKAPVASVAPDSQDSPDADVPPLLMGAAATMQTPQTISSTGMLRMRRHRWWMSECSWLDGTIGFSILSDLGYTTVEAATWAVHGTVAIVTPNTRASRVSRSRRS
jgi:hypothetical protein